MTLVSISGSIEFTGGTLFSLLEPDANGKKVGSFDSSWSGVPIVNGPVPGVDPNTSQFDFVGTDNSAAMSFKVSRPKLEIRKTARTSYKRTWDWDITKECVAVGNPPLPLRLSSGETWPIDVAIEVCKKGYVESDFKVEGEICVHNPTSTPAVIQDITDVISGVGNANVVCSVTFPYTLGPGETLCCTYSADLPDKTARENTACVVTTTESKVDGACRTVPVDFTNATVEEIDECVTVSDQHCIKEPVQICVNELTNSCRKFTCQVTVTCETGTFEDTATLTTNDTQTTKTASCSVPVAPCEGGCTLTWGYWKTHAIPDCGNSGIGVCL